MQQYGRGAFLHPSQDSDSSAPPPPPAHLTLSMQQRSQPPSYDTRPTPPASNPFNDSNIALSQTPSRNSAASMQQDAGYFYQNNGFEAAAVGRPREGSLQPATPHRNSTYSSYSNEIPPDPLARNPALQQPYGPYANPAYAAPQSFRDFQQSMPLNNHPGQFGDGPYTRVSSAWDPRIAQGDFNPDEIADDGDDGLNREMPRRKSVLGFGRSKSSLGSGVAVGAATGGVVDAIRNVSGSHPSGNYGPVPQVPVYEKSRDLAEEAAARKRKKLIFIILGILVLIGAIGGAVAGGIIASKNQSDGSSSSSKSGPAPSAELNLQSPDVQSLMNNKDLHRVFPGIDYTPMNAQYPDCLTSPPSQDNVTMDVAILSQLTKTIRLYGTDCNQTDMILTALDTLKIDDIKLWLGVWLNDNKTTNDRGMNAMWDILGRKGKDPFAGVIIGNEVLYREDMTAAELTTIVQGVRKNFTSKNMDLPIAVADLGDNWTADLVKDVDVVMSNVHPFFGGVEASAAAEWTWNFWETHDVVLTQGTNKKNIISETGWPSEGGNDCGQAKCTSDKEGAVANVDGMNTFMEGFVCQSLANGTDYFW